MYNLIGMFGGPAAFHVPVLKPCLSCTATLPRKGLLESRLNCFLHQSARILDARVENSVHSNRNAQGGMSLALIGSLLSLL